MCMDHMIFQVKLPNKEIIIHSVSLNEDEQSVFDLLFMQ